MIYKTWREGDAMTCCGRFFHMHDAATKNDQSPTVMRPVQRTTSIDDDAKRCLRSAWESAGRLSLLAMTAQTHLNTSTVSLKSIRYFTLSQFQTTADGITNSVPTRIGAYGNLWSWRLLADQRISVFLTFSWSSMAVQICGVSKLCFESKQGGVF